MSSSKGGRTLEKEENDGRGKAINRAFKDKTSKHELDGMSCFRGGGGKKPSTFKKKMEGKKD